MSQIEKTVSNLITSHFPYFIQEEGPVFVEFVKQYYEWMEQYSTSGVGNPLYYSRNFLDNKDIDTTVDSFVVYFKEKYLKNIQFNTAASTRKMVKHSLDLYRSKGTKRAIDLLFKVVFDTPADVYLPGDDMFKLSSGDWYEQTYLEVSSSPTNIFFVGKQITGLQSGTTAFVEKLTRKKIKNVFIEVFTISLTIQGSHFITGELIKTTSQSSYYNNPKIIGSLTTVTVITGSKNFAIGDTVDITSYEGIGAKGLVTDISDITGKVKFILVDGGFGYTKNANVIISEKVLHLANVQITNANYTVDSYFNNFDYITSKQAQINYANATSDFAIGANLYTYSGGSQTGKAIIQGISGNSLSGNLYLSVLSGNMISTKYYTESNTITANAGIIPYIDQSASANTIGTRDTITINYSNSSSFILNEPVYQYSNVGIETASGIVTELLVTNKRANTGIIAISNVYGLFVNTKPLIGSISNNSANIDSISIELGIVLATPATFTRTGNTISGNIISVAATSIGIAPAATVTISNNSFVITGASSSGNVVTVVDTTHIIAGSPITITSGTGVLATNTYVSTIESPSTFTLTNIPTTPLSSASILVWPYVGELSTLTTTTVVGIINTHAITLSQQPSIPLANATLIFTPAKFQFYSNAGNFITSSNWYDGNTYSNATITSISHGYLANFNIPSTLSYPETLAINTDFVLDYLDVPLNAFDYGISPTVIANDSNSNVLANILNFEEITIGGITSLVGIDEGAEYDVAPIVNINEKIISVYDKKDIIIFYTNATKNFAINEIITQNNIVPITPNTSGVNASSNSILIASANTLFSINEKIYYNVLPGDAPIGGLTGNTYYYVVTANSSAIQLSTVSGDPAIVITESNTSLRSPQYLIADTGARGLVKSVNSISISVKLINFENNFYNGYVIKGDSSLCSALVTGITVDNKTKPMGDNAIVTANVIVEQGAVTNLKIIDSGFGYVNKEFGQFISSDGLRAGTVVMNLGTRNELDTTKIGQEGKAAGYYRTQNGFLSSSKKIRDGEYYQEFSYEVRSAVTLDKYEAMLKQLLHVAGTKYFAATIITSNIPVSTIINSTVEIN